VLSDAKSYVEIIEDHENGLLALKADILSVVDAIRDLLTDKVFA